MKRDRTPEGMGGRTSCESHSRHVGGSWRRRCCRWDEIDKYGRKLADIHSGDGWVNLWLIQNGWAWHYKRFSDDPTLSDAERVARSDALGNQ